MTTAGPRHWPRHWLAQTELQITDPQLSHSTRRQRHDRERSYTCAAALQLSEGDILMAQRDGLNCFGTYLPCNGRDRPIGLGDHARSRARLNVTRRVWHA